MLEKLTTALTFVILGCTVFLLVKPGGLLRVEVSDWLESRRTDRIVRDEWATLIQGAPVLGSEASAPQVVEFLDYQCHYCRAFRDSAEAFLVANPGASIAVRHAPNPMSPRSRGAAITAICASEQGHFEPVHRFLLTDTDWMRDGEWKRVAEETRVPDVDRFIDCLDSDRAMRQYGVDSSWVATLRLSGTPTFAAKAVGLHVGIIDRERLAAWTAPR